MYSLHLNANFSDYGQRNRKWFPNGCSGNNTRWATNQTKYKRNEKNNKLTGSLLWRWMWSKRVLSGNKSPAVTDPSLYPFGQADVVPSDIHSRVKSWRRNYSRHFSFSFDPLRNRQKLCASSPFQHIWWESHSLSRWESCVGGIATYIYCIPIKMTLQLIFCAMILYWQSNWVDQLSTAHRPIKRQAGMREIIDFFQFYLSRYRYFDKGN